MQQWEIKLNEKRTYVKCSICKKEITGKHRFIELAMNYGVICPECDNLFDDNEIELISNLFTAFGGHFGAKKGNSARNPSQFISKLSNIHKLNEKRIDLNTLDVKILHQALLHGISPRQIIQGLWNALYTFKIWKVKILSISRLYLITNNYIQNSLECNQPS